MPLRVAVDATPLLGRPTGIGQYVRHLLAELAAHDELDLRAYALTGRSVAGLDSLLPPPVRRPRWPLPAAVATVAWRHGNHPRISPWTGSVEVVHGTNFVAPPGSPAVVTVHDMTAVRYPELCTPATLRYPQLVAKALERGALVQTPSEAVAAEVRQYFDVAPDRVVAVAHGIPPVPTGNAGVTPSAPYLLATGTVEPRKDYSTLLRAFDLVAHAHPELELVVVGAPAWGSVAVEETLATLEHRQRVHFTGYVDEATRGALIRNCAAFVYPSLYEGFGLPPLEAMSVGAAVVATRTTVATEVLGSAAAFADIGDVEGLAGQLLSVLGDDQYRDSLIAAGYSHSASYSWQKCADSMHVLYRRAAEQ